MIKIAFVIDTIVSPTAGTEKQLLALINGVDRTRFKPYLICLRESEWLRDNPPTCTVIKYDVHRVIGFRFVRTLLRFAALCRRERFDVVQTFFVDANILGTLGAKLGGCRAIVSSRRNIGHWQNRAYLSVLRLLRRWTNRYLSNSEAAADHAVEVEHIDRARIKVIHNGLDLTPYETDNTKVRRDQRRQWGIREEDTLVGAIANLRDVKNLDSLVRVASALRQDHDSLKFAVVGDGPDRQRLEAQIAGAGLRDHFLLPGKSENIIPCLAAFDIAVLTSEFESFSNSLIEYMAAGLPTVASNVGGNAEAVTHEVDGLLYDVTDEGQLEQALRRLIDDRDFAEKLGRAAGRTARERFSRERWLQGHEQFYETLLEPLQADNIGRVRRIER